MKYPIPIRATKDKKERKIRNSFDKKKKEYLYLLFILRYNSLTNNTIG